MPRPGGPMGRKNEKSKDFFGSMKRLIKNLKPWRVVLILAITLAMVSAILALIAPNKLSDFTNVITDGLKPDTKEIEKLATKISENMTGDVMQTKIPTIMMDEKVSVTDKQKLQEFIVSMSTNTKKEDMAKKVFELPDSILVKLFDEITIDGNKISSKDQVKFLRIMSELDKDDQTKMLKQFDSLPTSIYNIVKPKMDMDKIKELAILLVSLYVISSIFSYIQGFSMTTVSNNFAKSLRTNISEKINRLPLKYFDSHETGDILSRVTNDIDTIAQNLNQSLATLVAASTLFIGSIVMMFATNWIMAITAILASFFGFIFMFSILGRSQKYFSMRQTELGNLNGFIEEIYSGHNVVKCYNGDKKAREDFSVLNDKLYEANRKSVFLSGLMQPMMAFIGNFGYVAVCIVGALLAINGTISFGVIVAFMIYVRLFTNPLSQIAQAMTSLQSTAAASERVYELLDEVEMSNQDSLTKKLDVKKVKGAIEFKHVKFGYNESRTIIKDFSVDVKPGQKIAIVGPTGAGKTTMVNLLMKFYEINDGDILIDGVSTKELTRENIHDLFCMVLQDTWLFDGSIRDNIKFNRENINDDDVWKAAKVVGVDHFIKTFPGGLNSNVADNDTISQGQKQLFTIARGMLEEAPFLILDEATSSVDTRTEELVQKAMDKLTEGKTSFIIAHRLSTIKNADLILVMKDGNIIEQGSHDELIKLNKFYAELYNSQFQQ